VDAISGLLADPCRSDAWGIDVVVTGSQKALMLPPGLSFISASPKAWELIERSTSPRYYTDLRLYRQALAGDDTPFTSGVSLVIALDEALKLILGTGVDETVKRCALLAQATRSGVQAMNLALFAKRPSNAVTAVAVPAGLDGARLTNVMYERSRVMVAGGQGEMAGKLVRIAHMGFISAEDIVAGLSALEEALTAMGHHVAGKAGVTAAQAVLRGADPVAARSA
jgi:aspartate aminotransferase-like enzyme